VAEPDQLALHPPVPQRGLSVAMRITSLRIATAVDSRPGRREHLTPPAAGNQPRQCCQPQAVTRLVADPQVDDRNDHSAMNSAGKSVQAKIQ